MSVIPSPNIWHWPQVYEIENRAQDRDGRIFAALRELADWTGRDVVDVGCGAGFHLSMFEGAASVVGIEPHPKLLAMARRRGQALAGTAERLPLPDASADIVHARTAYFFGPKSAPGIAEAMRVLRPGGVLVVVDLDATAHDYGAWMRADLPHYDPVAVEKFFAARGFDMLRVDTRWEFDSRADLAAVLDIEFTPETAARARAETVGLALDVRYRMHTLRKPSSVLSVR